MIKESLFDMPTKTTCSMINENVLQIALGGITLSQRESEKIVGSRNRLFKLVGEGKIRAEKRAKRQNGRWYCNAYDVIKYASLNLY